MAFLAASQLDESNAFLLAPNRHQFPLVLAVGLIHLSVIGTSAYSTSNPRRQKSVHSQERALNDQLVPSLHRLIAQGRRLIEQECRIIQVATVALVTFLGLL